MKNLISFACLIFLLASCGENKGQPGQQSTKPISTVNEDSVGIADALHTFFKWYAETGEQLITKINFVDQKGAHPKLDEAALARYFLEFMKCGVVSAELVENETNFYRTCATSWEEEESGEVISCMDYDRYYCGQDYDGVEFIHAAVSSKITGDRAKVQLLLDPNGNNGGPRDFEMKKEGGKWLLSKIGCE